MDVNTNCFLLEASSLAATQLSCQRFLTKNNYLASGQLQIPWLNTEHAKKSYQYSTVKIWNTIPTDIRELPTISHFKKKLKEFLKS